MELATSYIIYVNLFMGIYTLVTSMIGPGEHLQSLCSTRIPIFAILSQCVAIFACVVLDTKNSSNNELLDIILKALLA